MKKILSSIIIGLLCLSMFSMYAPYLGQAEPSEPPVTEWDETYGGTGDDGADCVIQTSDGGYALAGYAKSEAGDKDMWLIKLAPPSGMVSYWRLNEGSGITAYDSVGGNDGTLVNGPEWTTGIVDGGLSFDGIDDYVEVSHHPDLNIGGNGKGFTAEAWIKTPTPPGSQQIMRKGYGGGIRYEFKTWDYGTLLRLIVYPYGTSYHVHVDATIAADDGNWHHVAATKSDSDNLLRIYFDGELVGTSTSPCPGTEASTAPLWIGTELGPGYWFKGAIDEVAIHNRALALEEIQQHYENGLMGLDYFGEPGMHTVPSAPRDLGALSRLASIELAWNDPSDTGGLPIQSFRIYRGVSSGGETFIASVDGNTHKYVDSSVSTSLYFYYVTAVNSVGEGSPSNEVKCSSEESFLGLETVITLEDFRTQRKPFGTFTIQQNFEIAVGGSLTHRYWSQNVIWVWPITGSFNLMFGLFEIYESNDGGLTWDNIVPWRTTTSRPYRLKNLLTLRSTIEGDKLVMQNDCKEFEYSLTLGSYIIGARIRPPEIVIVGPPSIRDIMRGTVTFYDPTSGHVETYARIGGDGGTWLHGENWVTTSPHTWEKSENLKWNADGDFWYQEGASDQGLLFWPDYDSATVLPP